VIGPGKAVMGVSLIDVPPAPYSASNAT